MRNRNKKLFIQIGVFVFVAVLAGSVWAVSIQAPPSVSITKITGLQPGWVRVTVNYEAKVEPTFKLTPTCASPTVPDSVTSSTALVLSTPSEAFLDLNLNPDWVNNSIQNGGPFTPCKVTNLQVDMMDGSTVLATTNYTTDFYMDVPFSHIFPGQTPINPPVSSIPLQPPAGTSRWAAYPIKLIGVETVNGFVAYIEVEELPDRGTVGLRGLGAFSHFNPFPWALYFELGGGGEIFPGWGLSFDSINARLGIDKAHLPVEVSSPNNFFPYPSSGVQPPILTGDKTLQVLPWLPLFDDATYQSDVLNQRGVDPCGASGQCLAVVYNQANHSLDAVNGAILWDMDLGPIPDPPGPPVAQRPLIQPSYEAQMVRDLDAVLKAVQSNSQIPPGLMQQMLSPSHNPNFPIIDLSPKTLSTSVAPSIQGAMQTIGDFENYRNRRGLSPEELNLHIGPVLNYSGVPKASCVINSKDTGFTAPISPCVGFSAAYFRCPTVDDPLKPESLPPAPGNATQLSLLNTIPPYYTSRDNYSGTCGSHTYIQNYEALLDKYSDDLAPKRVIYVDGLPVTVPSPRVATSVASSLVNNYSWAGTHAGDPDLVGTICVTDAQCSGGGSCCDPSNTNSCVLPKIGFGQCRVLWPDSSDPNVHGEFPNFLDAYWPAREPYAWQWLHSSDVGGVPQNAALARCINKGFWFSGFCCGQGQPSPGVYRNYSQMVQTFGSNPLSDIPWSLGNTYFNMITHSISLNDRDAAIQAVIAELQTGLPVQLGFNEGWATHIPDGYSRCSSSQKICTSTADCTLSGETCNPEQYAFASGPTWFLPPELGACSADTLNKTFGPVNAGHYVNIVGYSVAGTLSKPDPFNSYFIIENNWGKAAGYHSFFYMNFAAFRFLATSLTTYRLDYSCFSEACESRLVATVIPPVILNRFLFPPDPEGPVYQRWQELIQQLLPYLGGVHTFSNLPPSIAGVQALYLPSIPQGEIPGSPIGIFGVVPNTGTGNIAN